MDCNGSMAEYLNVPSRLLYRMPRTMTPEVGAMVEPLAVALRAVKRAGDGAGGAHGAGGRCRHHRPAGSGGVAIAAALPGFW